MESNIKKGYLLLGPENGEKKDFIDKIKSSLTASVGAIDEYNFYPYDTEISEIIDILGNMSLFASGKIVTIKNCQDIKKKDAALIADYMKNPAADSVLLLLSDGMKVDSVLEKAFIGESKKIFWEMFESRKKGWVVQFFRKENIAIEDSAATLIVDMIEGDTQTIEKECINLVLFFKTGREEESSDKVGAIAVTITEDKIADFFYSRKEENAFTLFEHIAHKNLEKSIETVNNIFLSCESSPVQALGCLLWQIRNLYNLKKMIMQRTSFAEACISLNIRMKKIQGIYSTGLSNYSVEEIERIISLCANYDYLFRSSKSEMQQLMFPVFLYSVIQTGGRALPSSAIV